MAVASSVSLQKNEYNLHVCACSLAALGVTSNKSDYLMFCLCRKLPNKFNF